MRQALRRFLKYSAVGISTFALDLVILFILIDFYDLHYVLAAGLAFVVAVTINYWISRRYVFPGTLRGVRDGYVNFLLIALTGLSIVMMGMYLLVTVFGIGYLLARVISASITGFWNYLMNLFVNFKVVGKPDS